jgi:hypothetical protein
VTPKRVYARRNGLQLVRFDHSAGFWESKPYGASRLTRFLACFVVFFERELGDAGLVGVGVAFGDHAIVLFGSLGRYFPSAVAFDNASVCVCPQMKVPGWKQPMADAIRSKAVVP